MNTTNHYSNRSNERLYSNGYNEIMYYSLKQTKFVDYVNEQNEHI